jgi:hypothetical protein
MTEHSNDRPPAVFPAETSQSAHPSPLPKLVDIPEEEIWLAKQKSKRTRLQARCAGQGQGHRRRRNKGGQAKPIRGSFTQ